MALLLALCVGLGGCHPEAIAGGPAGGGDEASQPASEAPPPEGSRPEGAAPSQGTPTAGEAGLFPVFGVGPLANPGGCDFDDPFSTCQ
jgi:hypothetical protein